MVLNVLGVIQVVACLVLILTVLLQKGATQGLSGAISGGADTFYGKNKSSGIDAVLAKITTFFSIVFVVLSLILCVLS